MKEQNGSFEIKSDGFYLNGEKFRLFSGAMHYFRVPREYWDDRFRKMKAAGFNAVETVFCWNLHEPREGEFDFEGRLDIVEFCKTAEKYGLLVILRPGPYTCGEWDFGGFPAWLLKDKNLRIRCDNPDFMRHVENYYLKLLPMLAPLQVSNGGNFIAMQIENEYGSYGNDSVYLLKLEKLIRDNGIAVPLFTSDGNCGDMLSGGTLPHIYKTLNFGSRAKTAFRILDDRQPNLPKTAMEFWCGWFDHWGELHHGRNPLQIQKEIGALLGSGANFNLYMFHGGTNFGFTAGANYAHKYLPVVTSYDDAALLNEYGDYTPQYRYVRALLLKEQGKSPDEPLPPRPSLQNVGKVALDRQCDLWENLYVLGEKHENATPESMEFFGQNFGYILYRKAVKGDYGAHTLVVEGVHDIAYLRVNGKTVKRYDRRGNGAKRSNDGFRYRIPPVKGETLIEILVEGMGRVNYGSEMENDRKGIQKVRLDYQTLFQWEIYTLPFDNLSSAECRGGAIPKKTPSILKGTFFAEKGKDCFVDMKGFRKGFVTVNGHNLGRYWKIGPQRTLYLPAPFLKEGQNEIVVAEFEGRTQDFLSITDKHIL